MGHFDLLNHLTDEAAQIAQPKPFYNIGELIPESPDATNADGPLDACWRDAFQHHFIPVLWGDEVDLETVKEMIDAKRSGYLDTLNVINYLSNHDHDHLMVQLANHEVFGEAAFKRASLGATILMTAVGIPLIWMGEEFGAYKEKTLDPAKIDWTLLKNDQNQELLSDYKGLIRLRKESYALRTANVEFFHKNPDDKVLGYIRWNDEGSRVIVVANFSDHYLADYQVNGFPHDGTWHEWLNDYDVEVQDGLLVTDLPEYEAKILV
jgi:1,4-alpha-glucan branching enzyme